MRDRSPNGYTIVNFDGHQYSINYRPANQIDDHRLDIFVPYKVSTDNLSATKIIVL